jgi:hypothetical protein
MATGADVSSIPALREWLAALAVYHSNVSESLSGINMEIRRGFEWIAEQLALWQRAVRDCEEEVTQAKAELAARRFPGFDGKMPDTTLQERNLRRAQARLEHAEEQVRKCRAWLGRLPKLVEEAYTGAGHRLQTFVETDLVRGVAVLGRQLDALERYANLKTDYSSTPSSLPPPAAGGST